MLKAIPLPPERSEEALAAAQSLVDLSSEQLETARKLFEQVELAGEVPTSVLKRLVRTQSEMRKARMALKSLGASRSTASKS